MGDHRRMIREILALSRIHGVGPARLRALLDHFKESGAILRATARELNCVPGIDQRTALTISGVFRQGIPPDSAAFADDQIARMEYVGATFVHILDPLYPSHLRRIYDPPSFLFALGTLDPSDAASVAIVGTRKMSVYGRRVADVFATGLAERGITIISGLARGIDTVAHAAALQAGGRTIAVIGSGLDVLYPPENGGLVRRIASHGAVLSEFPMGTKPDAVNFPQRNRIVSGMSLGTLVVETSADGGAMITARAALDQDREVFAIPSPVDGKSRSGTNQLLREGHALLCETVDDIVSELSPKLRGLLPDLPAPPVRTLPTPSLFEQQVLDVLTQEPQHIDSIAERTALSTAETLVRLLGLEFKNIVRQLPGKQFIRI